MVIQIFSEPLCFAYSFIYTSLTMIIPQLFVINVCTERYGNVPGVCSNLPSHPDIQRDVQEHASFLTMVYHLVVNIIGFFAVLIWGPATDIVGRKRYFIYTCVAMILMNSLLIVSIEVPIASTVLCIFAAIINGSYGDMSGTLSMCYTAMADATTEDERTFRMGILGSMFFVSYGIGGLLTGFINKQVGFLFNPIMNTVLVVAALIYVIYFFTDCQTFDEDKVSLLENENKDNYSILNPFPHIMEVVMVVYEAKLRYFLIFMYVIYFGTLLGVSADHYLVALYMENKPFNASPELIGYYIAFIGLSGFIGAIVSVVIAEKLRINDEPLLKFSLFCQFVSLVLVGAVRTNYGLFLARIAQIPAPIALTTIVSYTTKFADDEKRFGSILAGLHALDVLTAIMASFLIGIIYRYTLHIHSGVTYFVLGAVCLISLFAYMYVVRQANNIDWAEEANEGDEKRVKTY